MNLRYVLASVALVASAIGTSLAASHALSLVAVIGVFAITAATSWLLVLINTAAVPIHWVILLSAFVFSSMLPDIVALPIQGIAFLGPFVVWLRGLPSDRRGRAVVIWAAVIIALWSLLMFLPNVPDLLTGLQGMRKTTLALGGIVLGCAVAVKIRREVELLIVQLLVIALGLSIVSHVWLTGLAKLVQHDADEYTSLFGGEPRLQGIFAGPFHVAAAGVLVLGWVFIRFKDKPVFSAIATIVSLICIYMSMVRSAYVALALVLIVALLTTRLEKKTVVILAAATGGGIVVISVFALLRVVDLTALISIFELGSDSRLLNRFPGYGEALKLFSESPVWGWGAGSAGDTLGPHFVDGHEHVTSHNLGLKLLVEGGLLGVAIWLGLAVAMWRSVSWRRDKGRLALVSLVGLLTFGLVGSGIEALPVTYFVFMFVGLAIGDFQGFNSLLVKRVRGWWHRDAPEHPSAPM